MYIKGIAKHLSLLRSTESCGLSTFLASPCGSLMSLIFPGNLSRRGIGRSEHSVSNLCSPIFLPRPFHGRLHPGHAASWAGGRAAWASIPSRPYACPPCFVAPQRPKTFPFAMVFDRDDRHCKLLRCMGFDLWCESWIGVIFRVYLYLQLCALRGFIETSDLVE